MSTRILLPYDGSDPSADALRYAIETFPDSELTALHVIPLPAGYWSAFSDTEESFPNDDRLRAHADEVLKEAVDLAAEHGVTVDTEVTTGRPHQRIGEIAAEDGFDTIVIGSHGRHGFSRALLGSVAEAVVKRSTVPVVVVR